MLTVAEETLIPHNTAIPFILILLALASSPGSIFPAEVINAVNASLCLPVGGEMPVKCGPLGSPGTGASPGHLQGRPGERFAVFCGVGGGGAESVLSCVKEEP